ncbi:transcriptional regulator [Pseudonocardia hispaniensis]|uniref:Transcriptional regulator n=1 Tax=Pseudonocardia hispaniensis TaxID=904933 RepID=A0ABW1IYI7_9PSEU
MSPRHPTIRIRAERLDLARRAAGLVTDTALADAMGIHKASVSRTLAGKSQLGGNFIGGLLRAFPGLTFEDLFTLGADDAGELRPEAIPA